MTVKISAAILRQQDDVCSSYVMQLLHSNSAFHKLAASEGRRIVERDAEDERKLASGIALAFDKGILTTRPKVCPAIPINVMGLSAKQVTDKILHHLPSHVGNVIVLQGLSGTGKGTTVAKLCQELPRSVTWSNGNVFRSYTYLCDEMLATEGKDMTEANLTEELLANVVRRVTFDKCDDNHFQMMIDHSVRVSSIENTLLKTKRMSSQVPMVAEKMQGEVIRFGMSAVRQLSEDGFNVILEGRAQTLNFIPTSTRFELVIPDVTILGERRAAQRVMAKALELARASESTTALLDGADASRFVAESLNTMDLS